MRLLVFVLILLGCVALPVRAQPAVAGEERPSSSSIEKVAAPYLVGSGIADITGPPADVMMQGYVDFAQKTNGIHTRLWARAFVVVDPGTGRRAALVTIDQIHVYQAVTSRVVALLRARFGDLYTDRNLLIAATHTHSAPGGFSHHFLYNVSTLGHSPENLERIAQGVFQAIVRAHEGLTPGTLRLAVGTLPEASVNRSPDAYLRNPLEERAGHPDNVDREMTLLRFDAADGRELGVIAWFAVHATSIKRHNKRVHGDNKGVAEYLFERAKGARYDGSPTFVAAFPNSNAGDVSPSAGADLNGDGEWDCPLESDLACAEASGRRQFEAASALHARAVETVERGVDTRHAYVRFPALAVAAPFGGGEERRLCEAGIGLSMLAGARDGVGVGRQGQRCSDGSSLAKALCIRNRCHGEKPVVLATGRHRRRPWTPEVLPLQIIRIGPLALVAVPAEFTTMAGRRLRETVLEALEPMGVTHAVLAGYANAYAGYVSTREEYQQQNYEGASTHFGEWTLAAYQQEMRGLAQAMREGREIDTAVAPPDYSRGQWLTTPGARYFDRVPRGTKFGDVLEDALERYAPGEVVRVSFRAGYPNNDLALPTLMEVQREGERGWETVARDWDLETRLTWQRTGWWRSKVLVEWAIPADAPPGRYRIVHRGTRKRRGGIAPYEGQSRVFWLEARGRGTP